MKRSVLVVDDDNIICNMLKNLFEDRGYDVTTAFNGTEAFSKISSKHFDIVVTDLLLGDATGIEVLKKVKQIDKLIPVVMITGLHDPRTTINAHHNGVDDFILKPFALEDLIEKVEKCLEKRERKLRERYSQYQAARCTNEDLTTHM